MSALDLTNPAHVEALRWACYYVPGHLYTQSPAYAFEAIRALSSPEQSAAIVQALLLPTFPAIRMWGNNCSGTGHESLVMIDWGRPKPIDGIYMSRVPALIRSLIDAKDRRDVLAALREALR